MPASALRALAVSALLAAPSVAGAAEVTALPGGGLRLAGLIEAGDDAKLDRALAGAPRPVTLELASLGGNVQAALGLGALVRREGVRTFVPGRAVCASACGLVWLAGVPRAMGPEAHVGLHAAYLRRGGVDVEFGAANALIGAYLDRLGFDDRAIVYLTSAAPDDMTWIVPADRQRYGIAYAAEGDARATEVAGLSAGTPILSRPMAMAGAIASMAVRAVDRLFGRRAEAR